MKVIKHVNCLDMRLLVLKVAYEGPSYVKLKVKYVNAKGNLLHPDTETVRIEKVDFWKWSVCD